MSLKQKKENKIVKRDSIDIKPLRTKIPVSTSQFRESAASIKSKSLMALELGKCKTQCELKLLCKPGPWESNNFLVTELSTTKRRVLQLMQRKQMKQKGFA